MVYFFFRFETSAKEGINVSEAGHYLVEYIYKNDPCAKETEKRSDIVSLHDPPRPTKEEGERKKLNCAC